MTESAPQPEHRSPVVGAASIADGHAIALAELPRPIGYVLGGGSSLGALQVGMLQALVEQDVLPDVVAGTSVGALNASVVALEPKSAANRLSHLWVKMTRERVFPGGLAAQARTLQRAKTHLFPSTGLATVIREFLGSAVTFDDLALPLCVVTTDVATAHAHVVSTGPLSPALLASAAVPGIYPPVELGSLVLYDGGLVANVPMRQALGLGARSLVVLDCAFPGQLPAAPQSLAEVFMYTVLVTMRTQAVLEAPLVAEQVPVVYIRGPQVQMTSPLDFSHTQTLIEAAYQAARLFLDTVQITGPGLYGSPST
jgi:NTE family protein